MTVIWILTLISAGLGGLGSLLLYEGAQGAPQQAVALCFGLAFAVIPYCGARALEAIHQARQRSRLFQEMETQTKLLAALANGLGERRRDDLPQL